MDHLKVCLLAATAWLTLAAAGQAFPKVETNLNADKSAVVVTGSNTGAQGYRCSIAGRITIAAARQVGEVLKYVADEQEIAPRYSFYM